jgi:exonuclease III
MYVYKVATLNINGIANSTRLKMLEEFIYVHDIDIALLQEVTCPQLPILHRYTQHVNTGTERRGTAIIAKNGIPLSNIKKLPSGTGIAATYNGTRIINIYAPSGAAKKQEREKFYNNEIAHLLTTNQHELILVGDFNCVIQHTDATGQNNHSRALTNLVRGLKLNDAWNARISKTVYTHYTPTGSSRIDRIYISDNLEKHKKKHRNTSSRLHRPLPCCTTHSHRHTTNNKRKRLLENEHIPFKVRYL